MKHNVFINFFFQLFSVIFFLLINSCSANRNNYFEQRVDVPYKPLSFFAKERGLTLNSSEIREDLEMFRYILANGYSGYDYYYQIAKIDFNKRIDDLENKLCYSKKEISVVEFEERLIGILSGINDAHISIIGSKRNRFFEHKKFYASNIIVEKVNNYYKIIYADSNPEFVGGVFEGPLDSLYRLYDEKKEVYTVGSLLFSNAKKELAIVVNKQSFTVALKPVEVTKEKKNELLTFVNKDASYIKLNSLATKEFLVGAEYSMQTLVAKFEEIASQSRDKDRIVIDFRGNGGGSDTPWMQFLLTLYEIKPTEEEMSYIDLVSPVTIQSNLNAYANALQINPNVMIENPELKEHYDLILKRKKEIDCKSQRYWDIKLPSESSENVDKGMFNGKIYFLCDSNTASAGEGIINVLRELNAVIIGENTLGANTSVNVLAYVLPNSNLILYLPSSLPRNHIDLMKNSGIGFLPDYWVTSPEEYDAIINDLMNSDK